jgi:hypothetical protein
MMKKSLLLLGALGVAFAANAQLQNPTSIVQLQTKDAGPSHYSPIPAHATKAADAQLKTAAYPRKREYNYVDELAIATPAILTNNDYAIAPFMWFNRDIKVLYSNGLDTVRLTSLGMVCHPFWSGYNLGHAKGTMTMTSSNAYTLDSVYISGYYMRNPGKTSVVDTLRIAYTYGDGSNTSNLWIYYYTGMTSKYGTDTVRSVIPAYDLAKHTMYKPSSSTGPAINIVDVPLKTTDTGSRRFGIATNLNVPAGNVVAATYTFISGEAYTPYDTAFVGSNISPTAPYKYNCFRPYVYVEKVSGTGASAVAGFPTYTKGNYNAGEFEQLPETDPQSTATYSPNWAWTTNNGASASFYQYPYVDFEISCPTCALLSVDNVASFISMGQPYPNPANDNITLPVTMKESAPLNVTMTNVMGQVVASQNFAQLAAKQSKNVVFNTASLPAGIYLLNVEVNGARQSTRVSVTH